MRPTAVVRPAPSSTVSWTAASRQASTSHVGVPLTVVLTATRAGDACGAGKSRSWLAVAPVAASGNS